MASKKERREKAKLRKKPIVEMAPDEMERTFDDLESPIDGMLAEARTSPPALIQVAAAVLKTADGREAIVHHVCEYGDGDGSEQVGETVRRIRRSRKLLPGETIDRVVFTFDVAKPSAVVEEPVPLPSLAERLQDLSDARH
jgi:hypothetical protein